MATRTIHLNKTPITSSYTGPGDIITANPIFWVGLRAYSAATVGTACCRISCGAVETDVITGADGLVSVSAITAHQAANGGGAITVAKLYDQVGVQNVHYENAPSGSNLPTLTLNGLGSKPTVDFASASTQALYNDAGFGPGGAGSSYTYPVSFSMVAKNVGSTARVIFRVYDGVQIGYNNSGTNDWYFYAAGSLVGHSTAVHSAFHSLQLMANGASSRTSVDGGALTDPNVDTPSVFGYKAAGGGSWLGCSGNGVGSGQTSYLDGSLVEFGAWSTDKSANFAAVATNQAAFWGY